MPPSWVDLCLDLAAVGAYYGWTAPTPDPDCIGERPSKSETGFAVFLGALAYFWSVGRGNKIPRVTSLFFHSGKGKVSMIPDVWSWEHEQAHDFHLKHISVIRVFPACILWRQKDNCLGIFFPLLFSKIFYLRQHCNFITWFILSYKTCSFNAETNIFTYHFLSYSVAALTTCVPSKDICRIYMLFILVSSKQ